MRKFVFIFTMLLCATHLSLAQSSQPKAVDLGLSVKWADRNLGASYPEGYGDYYAWGETSPKSDFFLNDVKYCTGVSGDEEYFNKYVPSDKSKYWSGRGSPDNKTRLDLSDDAAARAKWGGEWRIPTKTEWEELQDKCRWVWTGRGYEVIGPNLRSIFLPAAGYRNGDSSLDAGSNGLYWSSSLHTGYPSTAWKMDFDSGDYLMGNDYRYRGLSVRPVAEF